MRVYKTFAHDGTQHPFLGHHTLSSPASFYDQPYTTMTPLMTLNLVLVALFSTLFSLAAAIPVSLETRDVFVPPILYPHAGTVWKAGSHHNVTWCVPLSADLPSTNPCV